MKHIFSLILMGMAPAALADSVTDDIILNSNTMWVVVAAALVFFMQAGFALLESGMSRTKNSINVMMKNYTDVCVGSLVYWLIGFGLMFGDNPSGFFGTSHFLLDGADAWGYSVALFQLMFAATAATICSGAMAERTRFSAYLVAAALICAVIYPVFGSWSWGGMYGGSGWLASLGFIDFAGSTVVHSVGAWCALAGIIVLGPRTGRFDRNTKEARTIPGHNLSMVALGGFILWLGWFGFNAGSTLSATADIGLIALNTQLSAAAGALGAILFVIATGRPVLLTITVNGSIAGLVGITAGCASMTPGFAIITGLIAGAISVAGSDMLEKLGLDDVVGAVSVHGFAGAWGTLAAGMFVSGDLFNMEQIVVQIAGILAAFLWAFVVSLLVFSVLNSMLGLRVPLEDEQQGLDVSEHYEIGYPEFHHDATYHKAQ